MAGKIEWTKQALKDRFQILSYWIRRNRSNSYSFKLNDLFVANVQLLAKYPKIGKKTIKPDVRIKVVKNYLLVYKVLNDRIVVLRVWDSRQNPESLRY